MVFEPVWGCRNKLKASKNKAKQMAKKKRRVGTTSKGELLPIEIFSDSDPKDSLLFFQLAYENQNVLAII